MKEDSSDYYNQNSTDFFESTVKLDMSDFYRRFLKYIPASGRILDAGCGSGRDTKAFVNMGYKVTAFDASSEMVRLATEFTGVEVLELTFEDLAFKNEFDGIWACASLLHVPRAKIKNILGKIADALTEGGAAYLSFKHGERDEQRNGRWFNDYSERLFRRLIEDTGVFDIKEIWITSDVRPGRGEERWLNAIIEKCSR